MQLDLESRLVQDCKATQQKKIRKIKIPQNDKGKKDPIILHRVSSSQV